MQAIKLHGPQATGARDFWELFQEMDAYEQERDFSTMRYPVVMPIVPFRADPREIQRITGICGEIGQRLIALFEASIARLPQFAQGKRLASESTRFIVVPPGQPEPLDEAAFQRAQKDITHLGGGLNDLQFIGQIITDRRVGIIRILAEILDSAVSYRDVAGALDRLHMIARPVQVSGGKSLPVSRIRWFGRQQDQSSQTKSIGRIDIVSQRLHRLQEQNYAFENNPHLRTVVLNRFPDKQELLHGLMKNFELAAWRCKIDRYNAEYGFFTLFNAIYTAVSTIDNDVRAVLLDLDAGMRAAANGSQLIEIVNRFIKIILPRIVQYYVDASPQRLPMDVRSDSAAFESPVEAAGAGVPRNWRGITQAMKPFASGANSGDGDFEIDVEEPVDEARALEMRAEDLSRRLVETAK